MSYCLETGEDGRSLLSTVEGWIASYYYLARTACQHMRDTLVEEMTSGNELQALVGHAGYGKCLCRGWVTGLHSQDGHHVPYVGTGQV